MAASPMDLLKNPFLLPAPLLALNPNLYAAQLAQLQAAQLLFAKQQSEQGMDSNGIFGGSVHHQISHISDLPPLK